MLCLKGSKTLVRFPDSLWKWVGEPDWHDLCLIATFTSAIGKCNLVTVTAASTIKDLVAMSNSPEKPPP